MPALAKLALFVMVLIWIETPQGWKMATDIPIPVPPDLTAH